MNNTAQLICEKEFGTDCVVNILSWSDGLSVNNEYRKLTRDGTTREIIIFSVELKIICKGSVKISLLINVKQKCSAINNMISVGAFYPTFQSEVDKEWVIDRTKTANIDLFLTNVTFDMIKNHFYCNSGTISLQNVSWFLATINPLTKNYFNSITNTNNDFTNIDTLRDLFHQETMAFE